MNDPKPLSTTWRILMGLMALIAFSAIAFYIIPNAVPMLDVPEKVSSGRQLIIASVVLLVSGLWALKLALYGK